MAATLTGPRGEVPKDTARFADTEIGPAQTKIRPPSGTLANGFAHNERAPAPWFNWLLQQFGALQDHLMYAQLENLKFHHGLSVGFSQPLSLCYVLRDDVTGTPTGDPRSSNPGEDFFEQVVLGDDASTLFISQDGINAVYFLKTNPAVAEDMNDAVWSNAAAPAQLVVVGDNGKVIYGSAITPTVLSPFTNGLVPGSVTGNLNAVCVGYPGGIPANRLFVAVGDGAPAGELITSPDGVTWTDQQLLGVVPAPGTDINDVCWDPDNSVFVAVGQDDGSIPWIATSNDGATWTKQNAINDTNTAGAPGDLEGVAFGRRPDGSGVLVAVGQADGGIAPGLAATMILYSIDGGVTWDRVFDPPVRGVPTLAQLSDVEYINGRFVAVGRSNTLFAGIGERGEYMSSFDGVNWRAHATGWPEKEAGGGAGVLVENFYFNSVAGSPSGIIIAGGVDEVGDTLEAGVWMSLAT